MGYMEKTCYRFFGGFLSVQEKWLNKMAGEGYRLAHVGKLAYRFETYGSGKVQYRVEFIGAKPKEDAEEYYGFLESFGYRVFYKNINLNASLGKIRWRPWAGKGGKIASNATTYNRELLIVEKADNGKPFELHTTYEDKQGYYKALGKPYLSLALMSAALGISMQAWAFCIFSACSLIPFGAYQAELFRLKKQSREKEW